MIVDRWGREVPILEVRTSIGFVPQEIANDMTHDVVAPATDRPRVWFPDEPYEPIVSKR